MWSRPADTGSGDPFTTQLLTFRVEISNAADFSNVLKTVLVPDPAISTISIVQMIFTYKFTGLTKGKMVYARVYPLTAIGSGDSLQSSGSFAVDVPSAPTISAVSSGMSLSAYLRVSWIAPLDSGGGTGEGGVPVVTLLSYSIDVSLSENFSPVLFSQSTAASSTSAMLQSFLINEGAIYFIRISAQNAVGWSAPSDWAKKQATIPPSSPTGAQLAISSSLSFRFSWGKPLDLGVGSGVSYNISGYRVRFFESLWSASLMPSYDYINVLPSVLSIQITSFLNKPLIAGQSYSAEISAINDAENGIGTSSQPVQLTALDISHPPASINLCAYNAWTFGNGGSCTATGPLSLLLTWSRPTDSGGGASQNVEISAFEVSITAGDSILSIVNTTALASSNSFTYQFNSLSRDIAYFASVRAITFVGAGISASSGVQYAVDVPGAPVLKSVQAKYLHGLQFLVLSWQIPLDLGSNKLILANAPVIISYSIDVFSSTSEDKFSETYNIFSTPLQQNANLQQPSAITYTTVRSVENGAKYTCRVQAANAAGYGPYSPSLDVTVTGYPGQPPSVTLIASSPQALTLLWVAPTDLGAGSNVPYTRIAYEYILWSWPSGSAMQSFPELAAWTRMTGGWNQSSLILSNLTKGNMYRASVRAVNLDMADQSIDLKGTGGGPRQDDSTGGVVVLDLPSVPKDFKLQARGEKSLIATWNVPADTGSGSALINSLSDMGYEIILNISYLDYGLRIARSNNTVSIATVGNYTLRTGDFVTARIRAKNSVGFSAWSLFSTAQVLNLPDAPTKLSTEYITEANGLVSASLGFLSPIETGLGPLSTIDLLARFQLKIQCLSCPISTCQDARYISIEPTLVVQATVSKLAKVVLNR